ncbi:hypothetical protein FOZ62_000642, partial [Perkinsus olseni]
SPPVLTLNLKGLTVPTAHLLNPRVPGMWSRLCSRAHQSRELAMFLRMMGVSSRPGVPRRPQSQGLTERLIREDTLLRGGRRLWLLSWSITTRLSMTLIFPLMNLLVAQ